MDNLAAIKKTVNRLKKQIQDADYFYYILNKPQISDSEYDLLLKKLTTIENQYPQLTTPDSPTQRVSPDITGLFQPVEHKIKMLSLDNTYTVSEIIEWGKRVKKNLNKEMVEGFTAEPKIDGISCALIYQNGLLVKGITRGDGQRGEDITANIKTIRALPLRLKNDFPQEIEVRGEIYITKKDFLQLNQKRSQQNQPEFINARNAAAGSLKLLNPALAAQRPLRCFVHSFGWVKNFNFNSQIKFLNKIKHWGLPVQKENKFCLTLDDVIQYCRFCQKNRQEIPYDTDGVVVKIDNFNWQKKLGATLKSPRWAIAYKFPAAQKITRLEKIIFSVGRTGIITPVAILTPVKCGQVVIRRATLHNFDEINRLGLKAGDQVLIERAGEVIPKIIKVIPGGKSRSQNPILPPKNCPVCQTKVKKEEVYYFCLNPDCPSRLKQSLIHFASRAAMDIEGLGDSLAEYLTEKKIVKSLSDIYNLSEKTLLAIPLFKAKKANNLLKTISQSKNRPLSRLLFGLGIPHVGQKTASILASHFKSLKNLEKASQEELAEINEIGPVIAASLVHFFGQKPIKATVEKLIKAGLTCQTKLAGKKTPLAQKTFVFTGELTSFSRSQAQEITEQLGGKWIASVSKKTDFLVAGKNPGSKYEKAKRNGIKIISETEFKKMAGLN